MCGIAGIKGDFSPVEMEGYLAQMSSSLAHRGPNGNGQYKKGQIGLAHTRLSIIDLTEKGAQPLFNEDGSLALICNGEIYNYKELRQALINRGHTFTSSSDSEVILHLFEENRTSPEKMLEQLTGMFAFAIWDEQRQSLFVARDRVGIKPLYYYDKGGVFAFASEISAIADLACVNKSLDITSVFEYFMLASIPGPNTIYEDIKSLEPGHFISCSGRVEIRKYWEISPQLKQWKSEEEVIEATESLLSQVVKDHLVADVPVGTFLSAGIDSSLVTFFAAQHQPGIHTFTVSFPGEEEDEGVIAADTARRLGTTHHAHVLQGDFFSGFEHQWQMTDQPFAIASALLLGKVSKVSAEKVKVVLSGDGADELFAGYRYRHEPYYYPSYFKYLPHAVKVPFLALGAKIRGEHSDFHDQWKQYTEPFGKKFLARMWLNERKNAISVFPSDMFRNVDAERFERRITELYKSWKGKDEINSHLFIEMKTSLVDEMLTKCDRMTMRNGIEGRLPFLDHRFVEHAFTIPGKYKMEGINVKMPLRKLLKKHLGESLAHRKKTGFNSPLHKWLLEDESTKDYARQALIECKRFNYFNRSYLDDLIKAPHTNPTAVFAMICYNDYFKKINFAQT